LSPGTFFPASRVQDTYDHFGFGQTGGLTPLDEFPPDVVHSCTRVGHFPN
jgi:hypothetical protein